MKIKTTLLLLFAGILLSGNLLVNAQPTEVWNQDYDWNADRYYRGVDYHPLNNHLYIAGTEGSYVGDAAGTVAEDAMIRILDGTDGTLVKTISPSAAFGGDWGYGIRDVEVDDGGAIFATTGTSNQWNPVQLYYWANEDADPIQLWKDASGTADDFGGSFSVHGNFETEALIIIPFVNIPKIYYFEVVNGDLGDVQSLDLTGIGTTTRTPHVQALGPKITDGFWYNNTDLDGPVKFDGSGNVVASIPDGVIPSPNGETNLDVKEFTAGSNTYLAVSNAGKIQLIDITGKAADLSDVTAADLTEIDGIVPSLESVWPHVYGSGQEQAVMGNPDGSYIIYSLSGDNYIKAVATDGAPVATNLRLEGSPLVGEVKTAEYTYIDVNGDAEGTSDITWYRADDEQGTNMEEITANAGQFTYTLEAGDADKFISFTLLPVAATGTASDPLHETTSAPFGPVLTEMSKPVASDLNLSGTVQVGETLSAGYTYSDPENDPQGESILEWYRADDAAGTNKVLVSSGSLTYVPDSDDAGKYIIFTVTPVATSGYLLEGDPVSIATATTVALPPLPPVAENVAISGREEVGGTLTATYDYSDPNEDEEGNSVYTWYRADDASGTNQAEVADGSLTYTLVADDESKFIIFEVTPVTADDETGDPATAVTGEIGPEPAPVPPVASDVVLSGTPEVGAVLSATYTYTDDIDDPEGESIYKWYMADDATGTNQTQIDGADDQTYLVTEAEMGKHIAFEVTPVAISGGDLVGDPVMSDYTADATIASTNTFGIERLWLASSKVDAVPHYINPDVTTERGFAVGSDHIYIASRYNGTKVVAIDKTDGSFVKELSTAGISGGIYPINDIEVSDDGQILAAPLNDAPEFWIYKWENELADPVKWLTVDLPESMRLGDKFSVTGDLTGDAIIMAAQANGANIVRWVVTGGIAGDAEILTLNDLTSMETSPAVVPFEPNTDANMLIDGKGLAPRIIDKDLNELGYVPLIDNYAAYKIQSNSPNVFEYKGRTMAAFFQAMRQEPLGARIIVADITSEPYQIVDSSEYVSNSMAWDGYIGEVDVTTDGEYYYAYMLQAKNAVAAYRGELELPQYVSSITSYEGDKVMMVFDMVMKEITETNADAWTLEADGTGLNIDTIYSSNDTIFVDLLDAITEGQAVTVSYDGTAPLGSFNGMPLAAFGPENVENIVGADVPVATDVSITTDAEFRTGETLTGTYTFDDPDGDAEGNSLYQWYEATDDSGSDMLKLLGEESIDYVISADVEGKYVAFEVTPVSATGGDDYLVGDPVMSDWVRIIPTGVDAFTMDKIAVYPNPVRDQLTIENAEGLEQVTLIDITGKVMQQIDTRSGSLVTIPMEAYRDGIYYLKLQGGDAVSRVVKIVKVQ